MKKLIISITALVLGIFACAQPVFATSNTTTFGVETSILKDCGSKADGTNGEGITCILNLVVRIMTIGIGILGAFGITVSGVQYLTAGGNEEQTRKAKRRIFEIIIGLAVYVLIVALLTWLLPGFQPLS